nr:hypothetical protein [uncultured Desulfobulbus sp.]
MMAAEEYDVLGRRTLLVGDVNAGKTTRTIVLVQQLLAAGHGQDVAVLDLAPEAVQGIGGKFPVSLTAGLYYLSTTIAAPRLNGKDEAETQHLAEENARAIEKLFSTLERQRPQILVVNDATLYLQAGSLERFAQVLEASTTSIVNAYYGYSFADSALSRRERRLAEALIHTSDRVFRL